MLNFPQCNINPHCCLTLCTQKTWIIWENLKDKFYFVIFTLHVVFKTKLPKPSGSCVFSSSEYSEGGQRWDFHILPENLLEKENTLFKTQINSGFVRLIHLGNATHYYHLHFVFWNRGVVLVTSFFPKPTHFCLSNGFLYGVLYFNHASNYAFQPGSQNAGHKSLKQACKGQTKCSLIRNKQKKTLCF